VCVCERERERQREKREREGGEEATSLLDAVCQVSHLVGQRLSQRCRRTSVFL
jgi:hypothetical protein